MADKERLEILKQHRTGQDKYTYFLLAVAASAIAFSVQKTDELKLTWSMLPLGMAVLLWGASFYFGCNNLLWVQASLYANFNLLALKEGAHSDQPDHPQLLEAAVSGVRSALESNIIKAEFYGKWQFRLLIAGAVFFLTWHIVEMILRTLEK